MAILVPNVKGSGNNSHQCYFLTRTVPNVSKFVQLTPLDRILRHLTDPPTCSVSTGNRSEQNLSFTSSDGRQSTFVAVEGRNELASANPKDQQEDLVDSQRIPNHSNNTPAERNMLLQELSDILVQQSAYAAEKSWSEIKAYIGKRAEEIYVYKSLPLGQDRRRNRYWQFITSLSQNDPGSGRIFVELHDGRWRLIDSAEGFDALLASLDVRGISESHLYSMVQRIETSFKETAPKNLCSHSRSQDGDDVKIEFSNESCKSMVCGSNPDMTSCIAIKPGSIEKQLKSIEKDQIEGVAEALLRSNCKFLWVVRDEEETKLPKTFKSQLTSEQGLVINWCPQLEVLAHRAVACFLTHCGWNSTLEALSSGVPMIAVPQLVDQTTNAKFIADVWQVGVRVKVNDQKGIVTRYEFERCIREITESE